MVSAKRHDAIKAEAKKRKISVKDLVEEILSKAKK